VILLFVSLSLSGSIVDSNCTSSGKSSITTSNVLKSRSWADMKVVSIKSSTTEVLKVTFMVARCFEQLKLLFVVLLYQ
jgi:hypothetical protein